MEQKKQIFTLKQVVSSIRKTIEGRYQNLYWVKAEMHKLNRYPSGHCFPELLQKENGKIVAQIGGSIWKQNFERINQRFVEIVKEPLKEGTTLLIQVKVAFHENYGLSLQIFDIDPNYSLGELQKERQETLKKLQKLGLLRKNQSLTFPLLPKRIALISAETSKGLSDFYDVLNENDDGFSFFTMLFPSYLQGDVASQSIRDSLKKIEKVKHHFDLVAIVRGGGGEVGLSCYNDFALCQAIANFPLPVLTGIGHSTNLTVAEMISFQNAITPTKLGEFLVQCFRDFQFPILESEVSIRKNTLSILDSAKKDLKNCSKMVKSGTKQLVLIQKSVLDKTAWGLNAGVEKRLSKEHFLLNQAVNTISLRSQSLFTRQKEELRQIQTTLPKEINFLLEKSLGQVEKLAHSIHLLDPIHVLKRGYSITTIDGKTISKKNPPQKGKKMNVQTADFEIEVETSNIVTNE